MSAIYGFQPARPLTGRWRTELEIPCTTYSLCLTVLVQPLSKW